MDKEINVTGLIRRLEDVKIMINWSIMGQKVEWVNEKLRMRGTVTIIVRGCEMYYFLAIIWGYHIKKVPMNDVVNEFEYKGISTSS